jgi:hypothetical protein
LDTELVVDPEAAAPAPTLTSKDSNPSAEGDADPAAKKPKFDKSELSTKEAQVVEASETSQLATTTTKYLGDNRSPLSAEADALEPVSDAEWNELKEDYGLNDGGRLWLWKRPGVHGGNKIFGISSKLKETLEECRRSKLKVVSAGVRVFHKRNEDNNESEGREDAQSQAGRPKRIDVTRWRLVHDGVPLARSVLGLSKRIKPISRELLIELLEQREVPRENLFPEEGVVTSTGSYVLHCAEVGLDVTVFASMKVITLYVDKLEASALLETLRVGNLKEALGL